MHKLSLTLLSSLLCTSLLSAQTGPGWTDAGTGDAYDHPTLNVTSMPASMTVTGISQLSQAKNGMANLKPGQWCVSMTCAGLSSTYGCVGATGMVMGLYDETVNPPTFTPSTMANNMNPQPFQNVFGLMIEPRDGLYAICDWASGPRISSRKTNGDNFHNTIAVTAQSGTPTFNTFIDPALGYIKGTLHIFYTNAFGNVVRRPLRLVHGGPNGELTVAEAQGAERNTITTTGATTHSCTPVIDSFGEVRGFFYHKTISGDSDAHFKSGTHLADYQGSVNDENGWQNNGALLGGTFVSANSAATPSYNVCRARNMAWMLGSRPAVGTTATIMVGVDRSRSISGVPVLVDVYASISYMNQPIALGGIAGMLGINPSPILLSVARISITDASERAELKIPVPASAPRSFQLPLQGLALINTPNGTIGVFTNTTNIRTQN